MKDSERFVWACLCFFAAMLVMFFVGKAIDDCRNSNGSERTIQSDSYHKQQQQTLQGEDVVKDRKKLMEILRRLNSNFDSIPHRPRTSYAETPEDAYNNGYENGHEQGLYDGRHGYSHGTNYDDSSEYYDYYEERYKEGYEEGYDEGYSSGQSDFEERQEVEENEENEDDW